MEKLKYYFQNYKLLFIVYGVLVVIAGYEFFVVPDLRDPEKRENPALRMLQSVDDPDGYFQFELEMFPDRPQSDYLRGMVAFKASQDKLRDAQAAMKDKKSEQARQFQSEAIELLNEAREFYEKAIQRGIVSQPELYSFYAITMKSLYDQKQVSEEEFLKAVKIWRKHYPLSEAPPNLSGY